MKKLFVFAGVLLLAFSPVAAQNADSVSFRRADGKPVTIEPSTATRWVSTRCGVSIR